MAEAALFIGWGETVRGREQKALEVFNESIQFYGTLQQEGRIESMEVVLLYPHGGDLLGFVLLRGSHEQLNEVGGDERFLRLTTKAQLIVDRVGVVRAVVGEGIERQMSLYQEAIGDVPQA